MKRVLIKTCDNTTILMRQLPGLSAVLGDCHFYFHESETDEYDFVVVYESLNRPCEIRCPRENIFFLTAEPSSIRGYNSAFLSQFSLIITSQRSLVHPRKEYYQQALPWHVGIDRTTDTYNGDYTYDFFLRNTFAKNKMISVISSNKASSEGHRKRLEFVKYLQKEPGNEVSVFGRGVRSIGDKLEAIAPFKYHIVIENDCVDDYWTEKLSDCYLADAFPIYYGCPNLDKYFTPESFCRIDINKPDEATSMIKRFIATSNYDRQKELIREAKSLVLNKYNLFPMIAARCNDSARTMKTIRVLPEDYFPRIRKLKRLLSGMIKQSRGFSWLFSR